MENYKQDITKTRQGNYVTDKIQTNSSPLPELKIYDIKLDKKRNNGYTIYTKNKSKRILKTNMYPFSIKNMKKI